MLEVIGSEYPPTFQNQMIAKTISGIQYTSILTLFFGDQIFNFLNVPHPQIYTYLKERKMMAFLGIFFLGNQFSNYFGSTGAFEIFFKDKVIFSKLEAKRMPNVQEVLRNIEVLKDQI